MFLQRKIISCENIRLICLKFAWEINEVGVNKRKFKCYKKSRAHFCFRNQLLFSLFCWLFWLFVSPLQTSVLPCGIYAPLAHAHIFTHILYVVIAVYVCVYWRQPPMVAQIENSRMNYMYAIYMYWSGFIRVKRLYSLSWEFYCVLYWRTPTALYEYRFFFLVFSFQLLMCNNFPLQKINKVKRKKRKTIHPFERMAKHLYAVKKTLATKQTTKMKLIV